MWINELQYTCKIFIRIYPIINNRNIQNRGMSYEKSNLFRYHNVRCNGISGMQ